MWTTPIAVCLWNGLYKYSLETILTKEPKMSPHQNKAAVPDAPLSVQISYENATRYNDKLLAYMAFSIEKRYSFCLMVEASDHGYFLHTRRIYVFSINGG
jgi:hypothetical protein